MLRVCVCVRVINGVFSPTLWRGKSNHLEKNYFACGSSVPLNRLSWKTFIRANASNRSTIITSSRTLCVLCTAVRLFLSFFQVVSFIHHHISINLFRNINYVCKHKFKVETFKPTHTLHTSQGWIDLVPVLHFRPHKKYVLNHGNSSNVNTGLFIEQIVRVWMKK